MLFLEKHQSLIEKLLLIAVLILVLEFSMPHSILAQEVSDSNNLGPVNLSLQIDQNSPEYGLYAPPDLSGQQPRLVRWVTVTAYSSTPDQTDNSPFITANGSWVYDGLVAANFLAFGTAIKFPDYFGDKVFTVNDRMNSKYNSRIDVWMPTRAQAKEFGVRYLKMEIY